MLIKIYNVGYKISYILYKIPDIIYKIYNTGYEISYIILHIRYRI